MTVSLAAQALMACRSSPLLVLAVVGRCRNDLDTPSAAALPELVERLARQRLADHVASRAMGNGSRPAGR